MKTQPLVFVNDPTVQLAFPKVALFMEGTELVLIANVKRTASERDMDSPNITQRLLEGFLGPFKWQKTFDASGQIVQLQGRRAMLNVGREYEVPR